MTDAANLALRLIEFARDHRIAGPMPEVALAMYDAARAIDPVVYQESCDDKWLVAFVVEFSDGGPPEGYVHHRGTRESCILLAKSVPTLEYTGDRPVTDAKVIVIAERAYGKQDA